MIRRHHWKERLKINKTAKFERTICWKLTKIYSSPQKREILQTFGIVCLGGWGGGGHKLVPHHTNVWKFSQNCGALSSPQISLSNLVIILIFRRSSLSSTNGVDGFSLTGPCHKLKKPWKGGSPSNELLWRGLFIPLLPSWILPRE